MYIIKHEAIGKCDIYMTSEADAYEVTLYYNKQKARSSVSHDRKKALSKYNYYKKWTKENA